MGKSNTANLRLEINHLRFTFGGFIRGTLSLVIVIGILSMSLLLLPYSGKVESSASSAEQDGDFVFTSSASSLLSDSLSEVYNMPKVYMLEYNDNAAPEPDSNGFTKIYDDERQNYDGTPIDYYEDETIWVKCWKEKIGSEIYCFAEVEIAHPSQFKRKLAGNVISNKSLDYPLNLFNEVNAVVGMNADYCAYRNYGTVIHYGKTLRKTSSDILELMIYDSDGNLSSMTESEFVASDLYGSDDVLFTFAFGPTLVDNYQVVDSDKLSDYPLGIVDQNCPRAVIGQFGYENHYLLCAAHYDPGVTATKMAQIMQEKGVRFAYNMDGGQTATLMFNGSVFNEVSYGGQREVSDILYFATAVPND